MVGPRLAPLLQERRAVPLDYLLAEAVRADFTHRQHDMRFRLGLAVLAHVPMHLAVGHHAAFDELLFDELAVELDALLLVPIETIVTTAGRGGVVDFGLVPIVTAQ